MQSTATQYVGIDVHQATLVCHVKDEDGRTTMESKVAARREPIENFVRGRGMRPDMAYLTIARKIAAIVFAVWKKGVSFDPRLIAQSV